MYLLKNTLRKDIYKAYRESLMRLFLSKRISIINFKGGTGKTTLAIHLAAGISRYDKAPVLLVDVDHQSSLSLISLKPDKWEKIVDEGRTIDAIFQHFITPDTKLPGKEIISKKPYGRDYPLLDIVPSTLQLDETELDLSSTTMGDPVVSEWKKRTLICEWIEKNEIDEEYEYIIFDCPPATKLVTQNVIAASHGYIIPAIPDAISTRGIPHLVERMFKKIDKKFSGLAEYLESKGRQIVSTYVPQTQLVGIVVFRIRTSGTSYSGYTIDHTRHLGSILNLYPDYVCKQYVEEGVGVGEALSTGYPVYDHESNPNILNRGFINAFKNIKDELKGRIDKL